MNWFAKARRWVRPEELLALLYAVPLGWLVWRDLYSTRLPYVTVLGCLAPAVLIVAVACVTNRSASGWWQVVRDFLPFAFAVWVYENMHDVAAILHLSDRHEWLIAADEWMFGGVNPVVWMQRWIHPRLTDAMILAYTGYYFYPPVLALVLYRRGQRERFRDLMLAVVITFYVGLIGYFAVPATDPWLTMRERFSVDLQGSPLALQALSLYTISSFKVPRDCFPSLHLAVSLVVLVFAWRFWRSFFWVALPCVAALAVATIYLRVHYVIDLVVAIPLAWFGVWAASRLNRWWYAKPVSP